MRSVMQKFEKKIMRQIGPLVKIYDKKIQYSKFWTLTWCSKIIKVALITIIIQL